MLMMEKRILKTDDEMRQRVKMTRRGRKFVETTEVKGDEKRRRKEEENKLPSKKKKNSLQ
jgi:hypothetical protein